MLKVENVEISGWNAAIRGMRNAYNSWDKSDSFICPGGDKFIDCKSNSVACQREDDDFEKDVYCIGKNDLKLMLNLANAGDDHAKFLRMIVVYMDITAPFYWWKQFDTYKVGSVSLSCSTMHTIMAKRFELDDFSHETLFQDYGYYFYSHISDINDVRDMYLEHKDSGDDEYCNALWENLIKLLPESYNQKRTVMLNYQILRHMYKSLKDHKLKEWNDFRSFMEGLPYSELITGEVVK